MANTAVILHSIEDAEHCISNMIHLDKYLFSTHAAVDIYLQEKWGIPCQCLSTIWTTEDIVAGREDISDRVNRILFNLDNQIAQTINDQFNLNMKYYTPLYSYLGKHHYSIYYYIINSLDKLINKFDIYRIDFYDHPLNMFLNIDTALSDNLGNYFNGITINKIYYDKKKLKYDNIISKIKVIVKNPIFTAEKIWKIIARNLRYRTGNQLENKCTIILLEHLYNLSFLNNKLHKYNVINYNPDNNSLIGVGVSNLLCQKSYGDMKLFSQDSHIIGDNAIDTFFINDICQDFNRNINSYLKDILLIDALENKKPIRLGIWGNSPNQGMKALINEYILSKKKPVIGGQHGGIYGDCYEPWHFDSDFDRCDYFISYGFTESDLKRLYPCKNIKTKILPFGQVDDFIDLKNTKINIDILFPITNSLSMLGVGMSRIAPDKLAKYQIAILEYLNSLQNVKSYIKPFMLSNYDNCAVLPILKRLQKLIVVDYMPLKMFVRKYSPKIIIIEYPSSPLYEIMHLDSEIFLLNNPVLPYEEKALQLLTKRVHFFTRVEDMIHQIDLYLKGKVAKKRDDSFLNNYVKKPKSKENILKFIESIVNSYQG
jgi:hypothetical protein